MWFDAHARLAELEAIPAATDPEPLPVSQLSQVSRSAAPENPDAAIVHVEAVADVAAVSSGKTDPARPPHSKQLDFPHGTACGLGDYPKTWTGRVVTLAEWRSMTAFESHGSEGRLWNGKTRNWEQL